MWRYLRQAWSSTGNSFNVPSAMRFLRVYTQENGGSIPFEALSAKARLMVPVGAIESRWEFLIPCFLIRVLISSGRRAAKLVPERYRSALNSANAPRSLARSTEAL